MLGVNKKKIEIEIFQGDSGGPLTILKNGRYIQVGITSHLAILPFCRISFNNSVYTRVSAYIAWISKITGIDFSKFNPPARWTCPSSLLLMLPTIWNLILFYQIDADRLNIICSLKLMFYLQINVRTYLCWRMWPSNVSFWTILRLYYILILISRIIKTWSHVYKH